MKTLNHSRIGFLKHVLPVIAGLAAGAASPFLLSARPAVTPAHGAEQVTPALSPAAAATSRPAEATHAGDEQLRRRVADLERASRERAPEETRAAPPPPDPADREEQNRKDLNAFKGHIQEHRSAPVDSGWSPAASKSLGAELSAIAPQEGAGRVQEVDCRTDSCLASIEFPSYEKARAEMPTYLQAAYSVNCMRTVMLEEPNDPAAPYTMEMVFQGCHRD
jgi:hypothetical protein